MLEIKNLSFSYHRNTQVLHDISLTIDTGFNLLIGENGSGKTTLMKNLTGILPLQRGEITLNGLPVSDRAYQKRISYLPQTFDVYPKLTVREILRFVAAAKSGLDKASAEKQIAEITESTNTAEFAGKRLKDCSEGMRRRVGIAAALVGDPEAVVLDEPTAGVDPKERFQFYKTIQTCFPNKIVLISTHILDDVDFLATNVIMVSGGRVRYTGSYEAFKNTLKGTRREATVEDVWMYYQNGGDGDV